jgi:sulfopropanediol 3-dehydrogenase
MPHKTLKSPTPTDASRGGPTEVEQTVADVIDAIRTRGDAAVREYSLRFDNWAPESFLLDEADVKNIISQVPDQVISDIEEVQANVRRFAEAQLASLSPIEVQTAPGVTLGQRHVPVAAAGAYVPGGRYPLTASAHMTIVTAKVAGVPRVAACTPPIRGEIPAATVAAMYLAGADEIYLLGGVQAVTALAVDLLSQAEHGPDSPAVLITTSERVARQAMSHIDELLPGMPTKDFAERSWRDHGQVHVVDTLDEAYALADGFASEHVQILTADPRAALEQMRDYGALFLGEGTCVSYGDKVIGTNHVLPTRGAARYTGGLWVGKYLKAGRPGGTVRGPRPFRRRPARQVHRRAAVMDRPRLQPMMSTAAPSLPGSVRRGRCSGRRPWRLRRGRSAPSRSCR